MKYVKQKYNICTYMYVVLKQEKHQPVHASCNFFRHILGANPIPQAVVGNREIATPRRCEVHHDRIEGAGRDTDVNPCS